MTNWGSFSPDAYQSFLSGVQSPSGFSVISPALASRAASAAEEESYPEEDEEDMYEDGDGDEDKEEFEPNAAMAMGQLRSMATDIMTILSNMMPDDNLEPWVAAKITMSKQNLSAVADYLQYND